MTACTEYTIIENRKSTIDNLACRRCHVIRCVCVVFRQACSEDQCNPVRTHLTRPQFEAALALDPRNVRTLQHYGCFLHTACADYNGAAQVHHPIRPSLFSTDILSLAHITLFMPPLHVLRLSLSVSL